MSRLTDLRTIFRGLSYPYAWSMLTVAPEIASHIANARAMVSGLIRSEEEAVERERLLDETYELARLAWDAEEPARPWKEETEYERLTREWRAREPKKWWYRVGPP